MSPVSYEALGLIAPVARIPNPHGAPDVASILDEPLAATPDADAVVSRHARLTYRALDEAVCAATEAFRSIGIGPGDRVAASMGNHAEIVVAFLASQRLGAIWLGINRAYAGPEKAHMLRDAGASILLADPQTAAQVAAFRSELPDLRRLVEVDSANPSTSEWRELVAPFAGAPRRDAAIDPWAPAALGYTSGTTGYPKGVVHSQHNMAVAAGVRRANAAGVSGRHGVATPLTILNLMIVGPLFSFAKAGMVCCIERLYAPEIAAWIKQERLESLSSAPAVLYDMVMDPNIAPEDVASFRTVGLGGANVPEAQRALYREFFGDKMTYSYGLTEAPTGVTSTAPGEAVVEGSVGRPLPHLQVRIVDPKGKALPTQTVGEISIGPQESGEWAGVYTPMLGYWRKPAASAASLRGGWLHTGDLGSLDESGALFIRGRLKDMIIRGGANVYPAEVERVLQEDDGVLYCAVAGKPDARLGEVVAAFIQAKDPAVPADELKARLIDRCQKNLSKYKVPTEWVFVESMPRNDMNKIVKPRLIALHFPR